MGGKPHPVHLTSSREGGGRPPWDSAGPLPTRRFTPTFLLDLPPSVTVSLCHQRHARTSQTCPRPLPHSAPVCRLNVHQPWLPTATERSVRASRFTALTARHGVL